MTVKIKCTGAATLPIDELHDFQGNLKHLSEDNYKKLKKSIIQLGFSEPCSVWKKDGKYWILNAHQRVRTLKRMRDDGATIPDIPVNFVEATDIKEAKKKVLSLTSQFGEMTKEGLDEFMTEAGLDFKEVEESFRFPEIDFVDFDQNIDEVNRGDENSEWSGMPEFNQGDKEIKMILYFKTEEDRELFKKEKGIEVTRIQQNQWICKI